MDTFKGKIDGKFGIKVTFLSNGEQMTSFLLNADEKKYVVFFKQRLPITCSAAVEVTGKLSSSSEAKGLVEEPFTAFEQAISESMKNIMTQTQDIDFKQKTTRGASPPAPYIVATEVLDCAQNIQYILRPK